ncbi:SSU ribosomal protein S12P methylthiotransferase [Caloramator proteoclasticus DSM 10124]|uniref:Ribosomal protein uS12 methylthiotransferase RimO n=2 Tax=Clostridiaceae TaxID=31979 RepID=A0A1M4SPG6_9CLOT|nr:MULTISPECIES: 30S ribosomal protein S12 methylthiotransferase RimO [Caloramator]SHE33837.1 SSU ribosomal protein S12P methylthiotransferase [Caloramator proteoclasticus DSM 10124]
MKYKVGLISLGCDKNRVDAEVMLHELKQNGFEIVNDEKIADIIIVNTCGFIESAKMESIETILEMAQNKQEGNCKAVIATGCMAERYKQDLLNEMPELDAVVGTGNYQNIVEVVNNILKGNNKIVKVGNINYNLEYNERILSTPNHYAYLKIAEGCNNNCSYCIIPQLRGRYRSRKIEDIIKEAKQLANIGVKELIIVAQDTTMYGIDIYKKKSLSMLLKEIEKIEGIEWIRVMYSYPEEIDDELIETIKNSQKICRYFDMPIQHISDKILKLMNRRTTKQKILNVIDNIRKNIPDAVIRTSLIVGFPNETDDDFNELVEFIKEYKLDRVGIFEYSQEEGTRAALLDNQISDEVKTYRKEKLMKIQSKIALEKNMKLIGNEVNVIIDGKTNEGMYFGRTYADAPEIDQTVYFDASKDYNRGDIVSVKITKAYNYDLLGVDVNEFSK